MAIFVAEIPSPGFCILSDFCFIARTTCLNYSAIFVTEYKIKYETFRNTVLTKFK
jgi:hypothetical protein